MDILDRMLELSQEGYFCAQILLILALESEEKENPDLVRAMGGLNGGLGNSGNLCGALTGGACFLSYYTGKGESDEMEHPQFNEMIQELTEWFEEFTCEYGGNSCRCILAGDSRNRLQRCPVIVNAVLEKCMDILERNDVL
ncbi:MAG: C-GCAxxG-C-C family protein [Lachnospiraceae bacterium]|nr:C-GCAxxG-C-C family protein [Lachnospiraceae bacterium]MDD3616679.1 C-GCAxxG-C-C family protein [Lachnospiraceae bacterium]